MYNPVMVRKEGWLYVYNANAATWFGNIMQHLLKGSDE